MSNIAKFGKLFIFFTFVILISGCVGNVKLLSVVPTPNPDSGYGNVVEYSQVIDKQVIPGFVFCDSKSGNEGALTVLNIPPGVTIDFSQSYVEYIRNTGARGRPGLAYEGNPYVQNAWTFGSTGGIGADASGAHCGVLYHIVSIEPAPEPTCQPNWVCGEWEACNNNQQSKVCSDGCGATETRVEACGGGGLGGGGPAPDPEPQPAEDLDFVSQILKWFEDFFASLDKTFG